MAPLRVVLIGLTKRTYGEKCKKSYKNLKKQLLPKNEQKKWVIYFFLWSIIADLKA